MSSPSLAEPYLSSRPRARLVMALLAVNIIVQVIAIALTFMHIDLLYKLIPYGIIQEMTPAVRAQRQASEGRENLMRIIQLAAFAVSVIAFLFWLHRAYKNLKPLGAQRRYSPGWAVGAFAVPIVNLVLPFQVFQEMWRASDPETIDEKGTGGLNIIIDESSKSLLVVIWWGLWLLAIINLVVAYRWHLTWELLNEEVITGWLIMTLSLLLMISSIVSIILVKKITGWQDEKNRRLASSAVPPETLSAPQSS